MRVTPDRTLAMLDDSDKEILRLLQENGRRSNASIARATGLSLPTVRKRIDDLVNDYLIKIMAVVNPRRTGYQIDAMVGITAERGCARQIGEKLAEMPGTVSLAYTAGRFDIIAEIFFENATALFQFTHTTDLELTGVTRMEMLQVLHAERVNFDLWS